MLLSNLTGFLFYLFSSVLVLSCFFAVSAKRSVHSVLFLVLAFFACAWVFLTTGAEFIAMMLIIIYVGAIAVLFLFVVMMLEEPNADVKNFKRGKLNFLFSLAIGGVLFAELFAILLTTKIGVEAISSAKTFSIHDVGMVLYTHYFAEFQTAGLLFFTAMVGAIMITLFPQDEATKTKRQNFFTQISRRKEETLYLAKPEIGKGVKID
jgi:NADH-quinone oxidoreductase subunit J